MVWVPVCWPVSGLLMLEDLLNSFSLERQHTPSPSRCVLIVTFVLMQCFCGNMYPNGVQ